MHFRLAQRLHSILWRNIWSMWRSGSGWLSPFFLTVSQQFSTNITFGLQALWADAYLENPQGLCCIRRSQGWCFADSDAETLLSLAQVLGECRKKYPGIEFIGDQVGICQHDLVSAWNPEQHNCLLFLALTWLLCRMLPSRQQSARATQTPLYVGSFRCSSFFKSFFYGSLYPKYVFIIFLLILGYSHAQYIRFLSLHFQFPGKLKIADHISPSWINQP